MQNEVYHLPFFLIAQRNIIYQVQFRVQWAFCSDELASPESTEASKQKIPYQF